MGTKLAADKELAVGEIGHPKTYQSLDKEIYL